MNYLIPALISSFKLICLFLIFPVLAGYPMHFVSAKLNSLSMKFIKKSFLFSIIKWPGTIVHELSHAIAGLLSLRQIKEILFCDNNPHLEDGGYTLGYIRFKFNPANTFQKVGCLLIGASPILAGVYLFKLLFEKTFNNTVTPDQSLLNGQFEFSVSFFESSLVIISQTCIDGLQLLINPQNILNPYFYIFIICTFLLSVSVDLSKNDINILKTGIQPTVFIIIATILVVHWFYPIGDVLIHKIWLLCFSFYLQLIFTALVMALVGIIVVALLRISPFAKD
ncbi:MAG: hypothetical protein DWQ10_18490 [Calditrichaeota bacterium]|nr:MAG: hypothetical protein DWQ10_18490 [Calditrichota bacterium]